MSPYGTDERARRVMRPVGRRPHNKSMNQNVYEGCFWSNSRSRFGVWRVVWRRRDSDDDLGQRGTITPFWIVVANLCSRWRDWVRRWSNWWLDWVSVIFLPAQSDLVRVYRRRPAQDRRSNITWMVRDSVRRSGSGPFRRALSTIRRIFRNFAVQFVFRVRSQRRVLFEQSFESLLHLERHQVFACDDSDDVVVHVDDHQVSQSQSSEDDVRPIQRVVLVDLRHRYVDERFLLHQEEEEEYFAQTKVRCVGAYPLWGALYQPGLNPNKLAYNPSRPDGRLGWQPVPITCWVSVPTILVTEGLLLRRTRCFFSSDDRNCRQYSIRLPTEGWPGWVGLGGLVKYHDGTRERSPSQH